MGKCQTRAGPTLPFLTTVTKHFAKYGNISKSDSTLLLYDGHRSHINLTLTDWAKKAQLCAFCAPATYKPSYTTSRCWGIWTIKVHV
jgi:hypothetical protein